MLKYPLVVRHVVPILQTLQLEAKCFSQQEQLDCLQEQLEAEREQAEAKQAALAKELALRVDQVHQGNMNDMVPCVWGYLCR